MYDSVTSGHVGPRKNGGRQFPLLGLTEKLGPFFMPFKTKEVVRMAKSKLAVVERGAEQTVMEPETDKDSQAAHETPVVPGDVEAPSAEPATEEAVKEPDVGAAIFAQEKEAALRDIGEEQIEPPVQPDLSGEHIPDPGDVVVSFDKINEILSGQRSAARKAQEAGTSDTRQEWEKPLSEVEQKNERKSRAEKTKLTNEEKASLKEEAPPSKPEPSQEPKEAPRPNESEQIVYLNLSELHAFKNHPF